MGTTPATRKRKVRIARIGITGMIGAGKSAVADILRDRGYPVLVSDLIAKELLDGDPAVRTEVAAAFGEGIFDAAGRVDRVSLAREAFSSVDRLRTLNAIIHPRVLPILEERMDALGREGKKAVFVESALIYEAELEEHFDYVIAVTAPEEEIFVRKEATGAAARENLQRRIDSQLPQEEKAKLADFTIRNDGTRAELESRTLFILEILKSLCGF
jgi:dephospho-CoA kinase